MTAKQHSAAQKGVITVFAESPANTVTTPTGTALPSALFFHALNGVACRAHRSFSAREPVCHPEPSTQRGPVMVHPDVS